MKSDFSRYRLVEFEVVSFSLGSFFMLSSSYVFWFLYFALTEVLFLILRWAFNVRVHVFDVLIFESLYISMNLLILLCYPIVLPELIDFFFNLYLFILALLILHQILSKFFNQFFHEDLDL